MSPRRKNKNIKSKPKELGKKVLSFSFLVCIPIALFLAGFNALNIFIYLKNFGSDKLSWATFTFAFIASASILEGLKLPRFRTFIHELKHAVVIVATGNRIQDFHVDTHTGHVEFYIYKDRLHFKPLIMVAPYFLPLFSGPVMLACLVLDLEYSFLLWLILGATLAADLDLGFKEIHPHQTDIKNTFGGIVTVAFFIVAMKLMWCSFCLLWITGGWEAIVLSAKTALSFVDPLISLILEMFESG